MILDWDIRSSRSAPPAPGCAHVNDLYRHWASKTHPRLGLDGFWIEKPSDGLAGCSRSPASSASRRRRSRRSGSSGARMDGPWRSSLTSPEGRVKFAKTAYDKRMEYRGANYNHALAQITGFRVFDKKATRGPTISPTVSASLYLDVWMTAERDGGTGSGGLRKQPDLEGRIWLFIAIGGPGRVISRPAPRGGFLDRPF